MGASRWIGGYLGFILGGGPLGALAGFGVTCKSVWIA